MNITFHYNLGKNKVIEEQETGLQSCLQKTKIIKINGGSVDILSAPEPTDVNWHTLDVSTTQQLVYNIVSNCASFLLLVISFVIITFLMKIQSSGTDQIEYVDEKGQKRTKIPEMTIQVKILAIVISIVIPILNYGLQVVLTKLSKFEQHHTKTKEIASLGFKLAITQFINTAVISFLIKVVLTQNRQQAEDNIYDNGGLIFNQQYVFITNSIITGGFQVLDLGRLYKVYQRNFTKFENMTQRQINEIYEEPEHNLALDYSGLLKTMLFTAFYAPLIPIGILLSILGITILYFIQKYKILNHRTIRYSMSNLLSVEMIELMEYVLPVYCLIQNYSKLNLKISFLKKLSNLTYEYILIEGSHISIFSMLAISIGIINIFLPMGAINEVLFPVRPCQLLNETYNENLKHFQFDYKRANPASDEYARKNYIEKELKDKKTIC